MKSGAYLAIDLKSYYASVELTERHYDPLTTNLVVADAGRTEKTICLAVSPSLKALGIPGRARLFEVVQRVREVNAERFRKAMRLGLLPKDPETGRYRFSASSFDAVALKEDPTLAVDYIVAPPRMKLYEEISTGIFSIYTKYVSDEDIHVYSIDECFLDVTGYLDSYGMTAHELAITMIREVLRTTGITAAAGIGTNLYLAKVAMDIVAKHVPADKDGVRIAELDERSYRELLWCHRPLTDFWRVGRGISRRLEKLGCFTMGDIARLSEKNEELLYREFGINAELLIDHAWGWEPTEIGTIKAYRPETKSVSTTQVLMEPYTAEKAKLIVREMTEQLALDLVHRQAVAKQILLTIDYDRTSIVLAGQGRTAKENIYRVAGTGEIYRGKVISDPYGRAKPEHAHGTGNIDRWTSSTKRVMETMMNLYDRIIDPDLTVRRITVAAANLIPEDQIPEEGPVQLDMFTDYAARQKLSEKEAEEDAREKRLQKTALLLRERFGKNALLKGISLQEGATAMFRNSLIGGHAAEQPGQTAKKQSGQDEDVRQGG